MGANETSRKTWTQGSEPVVINCGVVGRFVQNNGSNLTVKNIAVTGCKLTANYGTIAQGSSCTFTNCTFRGNTGSQTAFWSYVNFILRDCAYVSNAAPFTGTAYGCDFSGNTSQAKFVCRLQDCNFTGHVQNGTIVRLNGGETAGTVVSNCHFRSNKGIPLIQCEANYKTRIMDCVFESNTNTLILAGLNDTDANAVDVSRCTFASNVVTSANGAYNKYFPDGNGNGLVGFLVLNSTNSFLSASAAQSRFTVFDSTFLGNSGSQVMTDVFGVHAVRCTFGSHATYSGNAWNTLSGSAFNSHLEDCDIENGDITYCVLERCKVHDVTNGMFACFREYCRATNTLVESCGAMLYAAIPAENGGLHDAEFVNCTFAANKGQTYRSRCVVDTANDARFVNCIFNSNSNGSTETDFSMQNEDSTLNCWTSKVSFAHCYYGKFQPYGRLNQSRFDAKTGDGLLEQCENPRFANDHAWSLSLKSDLIGKGDASIWTDSDIDLAGKPRLRDGAVDPGCYECWLRELGLMMLVR